MKIFEDITLEWEDQTYTIPSDRVFGAIARIEEIVTLTEINRMASNGGAFKFTQISAAYASVLRYAGAEVTTEEVYGSMFTSDNNQAAIMRSITGLMSMMIPPSPVKAPSAGKPQRRARKTASSSSRQRTK